MRTFCHINEFGPTGWAALPAAILLHERVSVWAPSFSRLKELNRQGKTVLEPRHIIELLECDRLQVMARHDWIFDKSARRSNPNWQHMPWDPEWDANIEKIAAQRQGPDPATHRVRIMPPERGWRWARGLKSSGTYYQRAAARYASRELAPGILEKAERCAAVGKDPVRSVLRDAKNHEDALTASGAWAPFEPMKYPEATADLMNRKPPASEPTQGPDLRRIQEVLRVAQRLTHIRSGDDLVQRVKRHKHDKLASELGSLIKADTVPVAVRLGAEMEAGARESLETSWWNILRPRSAWDFVVTPAGIVSAVASWSLATPVAGALTGLGVVLAVESTTRRAMRHLSITGATYTGPKLPVFLMFGVTEPKRSQLLAALRAVWRIS